jgi:hypothetical protein
MTSQIDAYKAARNFAAEMLVKTKVRTEADIRSAAQNAAQAIRLFGVQGDIDVEALAAELMHSFSITGQQATALDDRKDHEPWDEKRAKTKWRFWDRYRLYLQRDFGMPPDVVDKNIHDLTDMILQRLEDPVRPGAWDRRGMVVGSVQSGKTANYIGLVNKAVDAGYKLIIILAGIHSNLRSQTQLRVDEGVLGFDTQKNRKLNQDNRWVGVGKLPGERLHVHSLTSSAEDGDFNKTVAKNIGVMIGGDPVVLVIKKNSSVLGNLLEWVLAVAGNDDENGKRVVRGVPLLLIDDEADNASINTKDRPNSASGDESVSAINGRIREILDKFEKSAYVGYTATPFANIFVNPKAETSKHGEDIFPRSFIININAPSNYVGPAKVFGLDGDADAGIEAREGLPIVRHLDDYADADAFPPKHRKDHVPIRLPDSLKTAIRCFVLAAAARRARGQGLKHCSMLVHVTRFVEVQNRAAELVKEELRSLQRRLENGDGQRRPTLLEELEQLWLSDFVPVTEKMGDEAGVKVAWSQVFEELHPATSKIVVMAINGFAIEALDYKEHEAEGRSVIAIGGDKLSRGLTLEGLTVSYFLRTTRMYDTLMQMGRWFGYRPGYLDLCRLFTTRVLTAWYRHIALAEAELRREFDYMVRAGLSPENYGLRVRTHPDGMIVTAINKMAHTERLELSWAGVLVQTSVLPKDSARVVANSDMTDAFLAGLSGRAAMAESTSQRWTGVPGTDVATYVEKLQFPAESARASGRQLADFIRKQCTQGELIEWSVVLVGLKKATAAWELPRTGVTVGLTGRTPEDSTSKTFTLKKANIIDPGHQSLDLLDTDLTPEWIGGLRSKSGLREDTAWLDAQVGRDAYEVARELTQLWAKRGELKTDGAYPNGRVAREIRPKSRGLLLIYPLFNKKEPESTTPPLIGLALSFPTSDTAACVEYQVSTVWGDQLRDDSGYDD